MKEATKLWIGAALLAAYTIGWICGESKADSSIHDWLFKWQTMIAGLVAVAGAGIGAAFLHRQTRQDRELEDERRKRRLVATRAMLPLTLSALSEWIQAHGTLLKTLLELCEENDLPSERTRGAVPLPPLPVEFFEGLRNLIEYLPAPQNSSIAELLSQI